MEKPATIIYRQRKENLALRQDNDKFLDLLDEKDEQIEVLSTELAIVTHELKLKGLH